jgi:hypothetical protein
MEGISQAGNYVVQPYNKSATAKNWAWSYIAHGNKRTRMVEEGILKNTGERDICHLRLQSRDLLRGRHRWKRRWKLDGPGLCEKNL